MPQPDDLAAAIRREVEEQSSDWDATAIIAWALSIADRAAKLERSRIAEAGEALAAYFEYWGGEHEVDGCPQDDTCSCPMVVCLNAALKLLCARSDAQPGEKP